MRACKKYGINVAGSDLIGQTGHDFYPISPRFARQSGHRGGSSSDAGALLLKQAGEKDYKGQFVTPTPLP